MATSLAAETESRRTVTLPGSGAPLPEANPPTGGEDLVRSAELRPGQLAGRYLLVRQLSRGGMGVIFAAYDPELDRRVALKFLLRASSEQLSRVRKEGQALARLRHENVVAVHDVGTADDRAFVTMELVEGETLRAWADREHPWRTRLEVLLKAGEGLAAAHRAGLVHRDFKPDNVLVGSAGEVRVLDFGLAEIESETGSTVRAAGTQGYAPPEQIAGSLDVRSDIYSFAATAWEILFGQLPSAGPNALPDLPRTAGPSGRVARALRPALARAPELRPTDLASLLERLRRAARPRWPLAAAAAVAVVVVAGGALGVRAQRAQLCQGEELRWSAVWTPARAEAVSGAFHRSGLPFADDAARSVVAGLDAYVAAWNGARHQACIDGRQRKIDPDSVFTAKVACLERAAATVEALVPLLERADAQVIRQGPDAIRKLSPPEVCTRATTLQLDEPATSPETAKKVEAIRAKLAEAKALDAVSRFTDEAALLAPLEEAARETGFTPVQMETELQRGLALNGSGRAAEAEKALMEAARLAQLAHRDSALVEAWCYLDVPLEQQGKLSETGIYLRQATELLDQPGVSEAQRIICTLNAGGYAGIRGDMATLEVKMQKVLEMSQRTGDRNSEVLALMNLAVAHESQDELDQAIGEMQRALDIRRAIYGENHPKTAEPLGDLGIMHRRQGQAKKGLEEERRAQAILEKALGPDHPNAIHWLGNIGNAEEDMNLPDANRDLQEALRRLEKRGDQPAELSRVLASLGQLESKHDHKEKALEYLQRSLQIRSSLPGFNPNAVNAIRCGIGMLQHNLHRYDDARKTLTEALAYFNSGAPAEHTAKGGAEFALADELYREPKSRPKAVELARDAIREYHADGPRSAHLAAEVERWLKSHHVAATN